MLEQGSLDTVVQLFGKSFEDAGVETVAFVYNKGRCSKYTKCLNLYNAIDFNSEFKSIDNTNWLNDSEYRFQVGITIEHGRILEKIKEMSKPLKELFEVKSGLIAYEKNKGVPKQTPEDVKNRPYDYSFQYDSSTFKYLNGKDINNFIIEWNNNWLKYGENLAAPRTIDIFSRPRILVREITNSFPNSFVSVYTDQLYLNNRSIINVLNPKDDTISLKFLLGLLNSELLSYYFTKTNPKSERSLYPKLILEDFGEFPIIDYVNKNTIVNIVDKLSKTFQEISDRKSIFENRLMNRFELKKINRKLKSFYQLDFKEFCNELKKLKVKLTLDEEDEWEIYFNRHKEYILNCESEVELLYRELNNEVYKIYEITSEEINLIRTEMLNKN